MLARILSFHQIMPDYLDFLASFGLQSTARDVYFSCFRRQANLKKPPTSLVIDSLGRSGKQYQLLYNLKAVALKSTNTEDLQKSQWSIRNAAFYHQFDVGTCRAVWVVTKARMDIYDSYKELTGADARPEDKAFGTDEECFVSSLAPHVLFCQWAMEDWRGYLRWLESAVDQEGRMAVLGPREKGHDPERYQPRHVRRMQLWAEMAGEAVVVLEGNVDVMSSLRQFYLGLLKEPGFPLRGACESDIVEFANQLEAMIGDCKNNIGRAKALLKTTADRREMVKSPPSIARSMLLTTYRWSCTVRTKRLSACTG